MKRFDREKGKEKENKEKTSTHSDTTDVVGKNTAIMRTELQHIEFQDALKVYNCMLQLKEAYQLIKQPQALDPKERKNKRKLRRKAKAKHTDNNDNLVLTNKHACFKLINKLIVTIRTIVKHLELTTSVVSRASYQSIIKAMNELADHYEAARKKFIVEYIRL